MEDKDKGISIEDFKAPVQEQSQSTEYIAISSFNLNGRLKVFELNKESLEIKQARIVVKRVKGKLIRAVEFKKKTHRYVAAKNFVDANKKFVELVTEKKYSEVMRNLKNKSNE